MATRAAQIIETEANITRLKTALAAAQTGASSQGFTLGDMSSQSGVGINVKYLRDELTREEKKLQRLLRGGRGMPVDMSQAANGGNSSDPYRSGSEVLL